MNCACLCTTTKSELSAMLIIRRQRGAFKTTTESERLAGVVACFWVALLVAQIVSLIDQGSALLQDFIELFSWVAFCTCHIYSWYTVIQAAQDGTIGRRYCLAEELMHDKIEKKDLKVRREWILFGLLWVVVGVAAVADGGLLLGPCFWGLASWASLLEPCFLAVAAVPL